MVEPSRCDGEVDEAMQEELVCWDRLGSKGELADERQELPLSNRSLVQPRFGERGNFLQLGGGQPLWSPAQYLGRSG